MSPEGDLAARRATSIEQITFTVLEAIGGAAGTRAGDILAAVIRHAHDLAREIRLQPDELLAAADFLRQCGDISAPARHEYILLADVLGLTMVVDTEAAGVADGALETSVLGPFYRAGSRWEANGANISRGVNDGVPVHVHGRVLDTSGTPVSGRPWPWLLDAENAPGNRRRKVVRIIDVGRQCLEAAAPQQPRGSPSRSGRVAWRSRPISTGCCSSCPGMQA